ncbi:MAG: tRNA adenosine(34) deaminase TadA [Proteobacteria bacterium]|nr:tRNA adenosine(34) deaminase TadA [Pseudomonadota bacterium]MBU4034176.1 tRNA adenosine(34) deaminase TadA [Pseudomonadota bacterium]MBU4118731.1 tRNA adenosine(34) deaminase TadA [Pseudomonadota bacterium]
MPTGSNVRRKASSVPDFLETNSPEQYMTVALVEARLAAARGEVPIGAVLVGSTGEIIAQNGNRTIELCDPGAHAEMLVLRHAGKLLGNYRLPDTTLYVTLEPCVMCAGALVHARVSRLVYGALDPKAGGVVSLFQVGRDPRLNHLLAVEGGLLAEESSLMLRDFFKQRRGFRVGGGRG